MPREPKSRFGSSFLCLFFRKQFLRCPSTKVPEVFPRHVSAQWKPCYTTSLNCPLNNAKGKNLISQICSPNHNVLSAVIVIGNGIHKSKTGVNHWLFSSSIWSQNLCGRANNDKDRCKYYVCAVDRFIDGAQVQASTIRAYEPKSRSITC